MATQPERIQGAAYTVKSDVWSLGITLIELALGRFPFTEGDEDDDSSGEDEPTLSPVRPAARETALAGAEARRAERRSMVVQNGKLSTAPAASAPKPKPKAPKPKKAPQNGSLGGMSILELLQHVVNEPAPRLPEGRFRKDAHVFVDACLAKDVHKRPTPKELMVRRRLAWRAGVNASCRNTAGSCMRTSCRWTWRRGRRRWSSGAGLPALHRRHTLHEEFVSFATNSSCGHNARLYAVQAARLARSALTHAGAFSSVTVGHSFGGYDDAMLAHCGSPLPSTAFV
jgi:serine/threonine protein kinase